MSAMTLSLGQAENAAKSFDSIQRLRNLHDKVLSARAYCAGDAEIIKRLLDVSAMSRMSTNELQRNSARVRGFLESGDVLQYKIRNALDLIGYTVNLKTQNEVRDLARQADKDSSFIVLVSVLSAFYIPGSFVAVSC